MPDGGPPRGATRREVGCHGPGNTPSCRAPKKMAGGPWLRRRVERVSFADPVRTLASEQFPLYFRRPVGERLRCQGARQQGVPVWVLRGNA